MIPIFPNIQALAANLIESAGKTRSGWPQSGSPISFAEFMERLMDSPQQGLEIDKGDSLNLNSFPMLWPQLDLPEDGTGRSTLNSSHKGNQVMFTDDAVAVESRPSFEISHTLSLQDILNLLRDSGSQARIFVALPDSRMAEGLPDFPATSASGFLDIVNGRGASSDRIPEPAQPVAMFVSSIAEKTEDIPRCKLPPRPLVISFKSRDFYNLMTGRIKIAEIDGLPETGKQLITIDELKNLLIKYDAEADLQMTVLLSNDLPERIARTIELSGAVNETDLARPAATNVLLLDPRKILGCRPDDRVPVSVRSYFEQNDSYAEFVKSIDNYYPQSSGARAVPLARMTFPETPAAASPLIQSQGTVIQIQPDGSSVENKSWEDNSDCLKPVSGGKTAPKIPTSSAAGSVQAVDFNSDSPGDNPESKIVIPEIQPIDRTTGRSDSSAILPKQEAPYPDLPEQIKAALHYYRPSAELTIKIEPQHLGKIKMKISYENGRVEAALKVENGEIKKLLESDFNRLKEYLDIDSLKIDTDSPDRRNPAEQFAWNNPRRSTENRNHTVFLGQPEIPAPIETTLGISGGPWKSRIDLFA